MLGRSTGKHYREVVDFLLCIPNEKYVSPKTLSTRSRRFLIVKVAIACVEEGEGRCPLQSSLRPKEVQDLQALCGTFDPGGPGGQKLESTQKSTFSCTVYSDTQNDITDITEKKQSTRM